MFKRKTKVLTPAEMEVIRTKDFFDCILPGTIKFLSDHYIVGDSYRCVWVIREYPPSTNDIPSRTALRPLISEHGRNKSSLLQETRRGRAPYTRRADFLLFHSF